MIVLKALVLGLTIIISLSNCGEFRNDLWETVNDPPDNFPPLVTETIPSNMGTLVPSGDINILFNEQLNEDSLNNGNLLLYDESDLIIAGIIKFSWENPYIVTFCPDVDLEPGNYDFYISGMVEDLAGNLLGQEYSITFTVEKNNEAPVVNKISPAPSSEINTNQMFTITFSKPMKPYIEGTSSIHGIVTTSVFIGGVDETIYNLKKWIGNLEKPIILKVVLTPEEISRSGLTLTLSLSEFYSSGYKERPLEGEKTFQYTFR